MRITELTLSAPDPSDLRKFYTRLGFKEIEAPGGTDGFSFNIGYTRLNFAPGDRDARYHFAFNVQPDRIEDALAWLEQNGVEVLENRGGKGKLVDFPNWKARSVYFYDTAGNIVEIIARAALPRAGNAPKFSSASLLGVSEIGIVCDNVSSMKQWISSTHGIGDFARQENTEDFTAMGDDEGLLLLVPAGRRWFMGNFDSARFPIALTGQNGGKEIRLILP
ncbi:MAG TPA: VOC family protein [Bacteroidia bacterium]|nr:VOC family protein [Bacteroidia bacterium]